MSCVHGLEATELAFMQSVATRERGECRGPIVRLDLSARALEELWEPLHRAECEALLYDGLMDQTDSSSTFALCVAHWFDITSVIGFMAVSVDNTHEATVSQNLFETVCGAAKWDHKELANYIRSRADSG